MYKQQLLFSLEREINLLKQLSTFIEEKDLAFRPGEKVRSTLELMQYLSSIGSVMLRWFVKNDIVKEDWIKIREERQAVTIENFKEKLEKQMEEIRVYFQSISDEDLSSKMIELPNKETMLLGSAIINAPIKWLAAYRLQLFLYLKLNGKTEIGTREAWSVLN